MAKTRPKKKRPPRNGSASETLADTPLYIRLLNKHEIEDFKDAFPNMEEFITPEGKVLLPMNPNQRLRSIYAYHDIQSAETYLFRMLNKFRMRGVPVDQIAQLFDVSVRTVYNWNNKLRTHFINASKDTEIQHLVGETQAYFNEIAQSAMRDADSTTNLSHRAKLYDVAMKCKLSEITFLEKTGFFVTNQLTASDKHDKSRQAAIDIKQALASIFSPKSTEEFALEVLGTSVDIQKLREKYRHVIEG